MKRLAKFQLLMVLLFLFSVANGGDAKLETAKRIIVLRNDIQAINMYCYTTITRIAQRYIEANRNVLSDSTLNSIIKVTEGFLPVFRKHEDQILDSLAVVYCEFYTINELKSLLKFYNSPIGSKMLHLESEIERRFMNKSNTIVQSIFIQYLTKLQPYIGEQNLQDIF